MDALEFYNAQSRYCGKTTCQDCHIYAICHSKDPNSMTAFVDFIEEWNKDNPSIARKQDLLEKAPCAGLDADGVPLICPKDWDQRFDCPSCIGKMCFDCRRQYWMEEF